MMFTNKRLIYILFSILASIFLSQLVDAPPEQRRWMILGAIVAGIVILYLRFSGKLTEEHLIEKVVDVWQKKEDEQINNAFQEHTPQDHKQNAGPQDPGGHQQPVIHDAYQADKEREHA